MPTITITGDTTHEALEKLLLQGIRKHGKDFNVVISKNLRFENQNEEVRLFMKDIDNEFAKYIKETGDMKVSALLTKIIANAIERFPEINIAQK